jgi:hypothetical protein
MSANLSNKVSYLQNTRHFPKDSAQLREELDKSYIDIANAVNSRTIGIYTTNRSAVTGNLYALENNLQVQSLRQVYAFTSAGNITHGLDFNQIYAFVSIYGAFTDGTNWYPLPYVDATAANNQINVTITSTQIQINAGGGTPPTITRGYVIVEWVTN